MQIPSTILIAGTTVIVIFLAFITSSCEDKVTTIQEWSAPKNLGPQINSAAKDEHVTFIRSGKTMVFASTREGGFGAYDLFLSRFENGGWSKAELLPFPINTEKDEFDPFITLDGEKTVFCFESR